MCRASLLHAGFLYCGERCPLFIVAWGLLTAVTSVERGLVGLTGFSSFGFQDPEHRLSSCIAQAWLLHSLWDLPRPEIKPVSLALQGRFLTTGPPGKPHRCVQRWLGAGCVRNILHPVHKHGCLLYTVLCVSYPGASLMPTTMFLLSRCTICGGIGSANRPWHGRVASARGDMSAMGAHWRGT